MAGCCTHSNDPPTTIEDGEFLDEFTRYDLFQGLIYIQVAKCSCNVYCVYFSVFILYFLTC